MLKIFIKSIKENKKDTILTLIFVLIEVIIEVSIPFLMAELIDKGIYEGNMNVLFKVAMELIFAIIISLISGIISGFTSANATASLARNLRKDLFYKLQEYSFSNIDKFNSSSILTRLTTDVTNVQMAFYMIIRIAIRSPLIFIFALIMALNINVKLSMIFIVLIPFIAIGLYFINKRVHPIFQTVLKKYDKLNGIVEENVSAIREVKSYSLEEEEKNKFKKSSKEIYDQYSKAQKILALNSPFMQSAVYIIILLISWFGAKVIVSTGMTELTTGELTSLITYATQILTTLMMLTLVIITVELSIASAKRITEMLEENIDLANPKKPIYEVKDGSIEFKNVSFTYKDNTNKNILTNINLKINSGETIGIIGGTGEGKSSLVNLIPRLYDVTKGELKVGGKNVKDYDIRTLRNEVSCVLQKNILFSGTIKQNIRWGNENATDEEIVNVCKLAQADEFISQFDKKYDTYIEQGGTNVSGGQKQRLCIARALLKKPKILILDDSTSAVDTKTDSLIRKAFREKIPNTTKIIIAQRISSVQDCDRIIVLTNGKVDSIGTHNELLKNNMIYKEIYESQMKGGNVDE